MLTAYVLGLSFAVGALVYVCVRQHYRIRYQRTHVRSMLKASMKLSALAFQVLEHKAPHRIEQIRWNAMQDQARRGLDDIDTLGVTYHLQNESEAS